MSEENNDSKTPEKLKCTFEGCSLEFTKPSKLSWHTNVHLNKRDYKCTFEGCDKSYFSPSHLNRHAQSHDKSVQSIKFGCKHCKEKFSTSTNLKRHINRFHSESSKICRQCNKKFKKQNLYEEHMIMFHQLKGHELGLYECEMCGNKLKTLRTFTRHKRKHFQNVHRCYIGNCEAEFYSRVALKEHQTSSHTFQYLCDTCGEAFSSKRYVKHHVLIHLEERTTFPCTFEKCNRVYQFKKNLTHHIHIHHEGKRFKCKICDLEVTTKQKLNQHESRKHKIITKIKNKM